MPLPQKSGGLQGPPAIAVDSTGTVHILYTDSPRLYYITRRGDEWSQPEEIAGPDNTGATSEINYPMLSITGGNLLHALYTRDAQAVYYQQRTIDAPYQAQLSSYDQASAQPEPTLATLDPAEIADAVAEAGSLTHSDPRSTRRSIRSPISAIAIGILPALLVIVGVGAYSRHFKRRTKGS